MNMWICGLLVLASICYVLESIDSGKRIWLIPAVVAFIGALGWYQ